MRTFILGVFIACSQIVSAQVYYGLTNTGQLYTFFANSCTACLSPWQPTGINPANLFTNGDIMVLPNGNIVINQGDQLLQYAPPNPNPISSQIGTYYGGSAPAPGGLIYLAGGNTSPTNLYTYNPVTNVVTLIGAFPPGLLSLSDLFFFNGQLYGVGTGFQVWQVNVSNPAASTQVGTTFNTDLGIADNGFFIADLGGGTQAYGQFNPTTGVNSFSCTLPPGSPTFISLQQIPAGAPQPAPCTCTTDAGTQDISSVVLCLPDPLVVPYNNNAVLDGNDVLNYVLVSNPANPAGSILLSSTSATIPFNPALLQTGVTYYAAVVAGNNLNGLVDPADPCRDFSLLKPVVWRSRPTVQFSTGNNNVCAGACLTVNASFTGAAPFTLNYTGPSGPASQVFSSSSGTFQLCVPAGTGAGALQVQATQVQDQFCVCQ
jgi:hypothetical protein